MAQKLGVAPDAYDKKFFDDSFGKINRMIVSLEQQIATTGLLSGSGPPTGSIGAAGSFYFDTTNKVFYGPKGQNGWPSGTPF